MNKKPWPFLSPEEFLKDPESQRIMLKYRQLKRKLVVEKEKENGQKTQIKED